MSIGIDIRDDERTRCIKEAVNRKVDHMDEGSLEFYTKTSMQDYYLNVAAKEEVDQFIKDNEYLPF